MTETRQSVALVRTVEQYRRLRQQYPAAALGVIVGLATHLSLATAIRHDGARFWHYTDLIAAHDYEEAMEEALQLSRSWFTDLAGAVAPANLLESVRLEMLQWFGELFMAHRVITSLVEQLHPGHLLIVGEPQGKVEAVLAYEAERRGLPVTFLPEQAPADARSPGRKVPVVARQLAHNGRILVGHWLRQLARRRPVLLTFGGGVDYVNQQRIAPAIEQSGAVRTVLVRSAEAGQAAFNRPGKLEHPFLFFVPLNSMLCSRRYLPRCQAWLHAFRQGQADYRGPHPFLFSNRHLDPFFESICLRLFSHALAIQRDMQGLLRWTRPRLVLTNSEVSFANRTLVLEANRRRISTLGLIHSGLNQMHYRDFQSDRMVVWGQTHLQDLCRVLNEPASRLEPLGSPQYDTFTCGQEAGAGQAQTSDTRPPRVLVITAVSPWHTSYSDLRYQELAWQELAHLPEAGMQLIIKPHPRFDDLAFYRSLPHQLPDWREQKPGIAVTTNVFLEQVLPACDLVVVPGSATTGAVEAMLCRKPVVYLRHNQEAPFSTSLAPGCLVVEQIDAIRPTILAVCRQAELRAELVQRGQSYLDTFLGPRDGQATQRLAHLIAGLVEGGR
jgi:hypothetical protein